MQTETLWSFSNIGFDAFGRKFPGFSNLDGRRDLVVEPRAARKLSVGAGDLLSLFPEAHPYTAFIMVFDRDGREASHRLGLTETKNAFDFSQVDASRLLGWIASQGGDTSAEHMAAAVEVLHEPIILRVAAECDVWILNPIRQDQLAFADSRGAFVVGHKKPEGTLIAPEPLGNVVDEFVVESGTALAYQLRRGQKLQIIDLEGQQCSDFQAFNAKMLDKGIERKISSTATRSMVRSAFPRPGLHDKYYDIDMSPLLRVLRDTCGRHDTFSLACTARSYEDRGFPGHVNCSDNISYAMSPYGVEKRDAWPAINLFWNTWVDDTHHLNTEESWSRPGDYVVMEAMEELVCVSTACPDEIDPINGWNPTDVLVRIYDENEKITRAVGYREKEELPMLTSEESAFHERLAPLTEHFAPARDLWMPVSFASTGTIEEYWACRNAVTVQDMSGLRKFDVVGPDAEKLLQMATTRDVAKLAVWRGHYTLMCDEAGTLIDDGTIFRVAPHLFRWCGGSEQSGRNLQRLAEETGLQVRINALRNALPNLAIQGPNSRELMKRMCYTRPSEPSIDHLKWFGVTIARLHDRNGAPFMVSRTGYTGELGYEIFCGKSDAIEIWDAVMEAGEDLGITPMGGAALEIIRVEAGLAAANAEFAPNVNAFEAGLGFAVDLRKEGFVGKEALERAKASPSKVLKGLVFEGDDVPLHGAPVYKGERQVGVITSSTRSPTLECAIAMARLAVEYSEDGAELEIGQMDGRMKRLTGKVCAPAFVDPQRTRARV